MTTFDMRATAVHIRENVGDDLAIQITCVDSNAAAVDISGYTFTAEVLGGDAAVSFAVSVSGAGSNILTATLTDAETTAIGTAPGLTWALVATAGGSTNNWFGGEFILSPVGTPKSGGSDATLTTTISAAITATLEVGIPTTPLLGAVNTQTGTNYTLAASDNGTVGVVCTNAALVAVTIPTNAAVPLSVGYQADIFAAGAAGVTLTTTSLTLLGSSPNKTIAQNQIITVRKTATDTWLIIGGTAA